MSKLENSINRKLGLVMLVQVTAICLAIAAQLDLSLNRRNDSSNFLVLGLGLGVGLMVGWFTRRLLVRQLERFTFRLSLPMWVGMLTAAFLFTGLFFYLRVSYPMDWRTLLPVAFISTLPGTLVGGWVSRHISLDIVKSEPKPLNNPTLNTMKEQLQEAQKFYPGTTGELFRSPYLAKISVPRGREKLVFYIACDESYPKTPPTAVAAELMVGNNNHPLEYNAPIIHYWNSSYGFKDIIQEALQILVY